MYIQDHKVTFTQKNYPLLSYLRMLLDTSPEEKRNFLQQAHWYADTPASMDTYDGAEGGTNNGFNERASKIAHSKKCTLFTTVALDFNIAQLLPDQTELSFRFHRSEPNQFSTCDQPSKVDSVKSHIDS